MNPAVWALAGLALAVAAVYPFVLSRLARGTPALEDGARALGRSRWFQERMAVLEALDRRVAAVPAPPTATPDLVHRKLFGIARSEFRMAMELGQWAETAGTEALRTTLERASSAEFRNGMRALLRLRELGGGASFANLLKRAPDPIFASASAGDDEKWHAWHAAVSTKMPEVLDALRRELDEGKFDPQTSELLQRHMRAEWQTYRELSVLGAELDATAG